MLTQVLMTSVILGIITPVVFDVAMVPVTTQAKQSNFQKAELQTLMFMNKSIKEGVLTTVPDRCELTEESVELQNYTIKCEAGSVDRVKATASRSFSLMDKDGLGSYTNPDRSFAFSTPSKYSHVECPDNDPYGVVWYNDHLKAGHLDACIPAPVWSRQRYLESNPSDWLYDLSDYGFGRHPDF